MLGNIFWAVVAILVVAVIILGAVLGVIYGGKPRLIIENGTWTNGDKAAFCAQNNIITTRGYQYLWWKGAVQPTGDPNAYLFIIGENFVVGSKNPDGTWILTSSGNNDPSFTITRTSDTCNYLELPYEEDD
jgi:hypothetical protein